ncbi:MAG: S4 domain-containing protein, partial [Actinomycetota bacterium]
MSSSSISGCAPSRNCLHSPRSCPTPRRSRTWRASSRPTGELPRVSDEQGERLQKVLAHAGVGSRRAVEEMIVGRRIRVNGKVARLGQ